MSFIFPHFQVCMCACVHRCGCIYAHSMQSPRLVPAITLHYSATIFIEQGLSTKRRAGSLLWGSHLHLWRLEFQAGICKGSRNPTYGSHTWMAHAFTTEPPPALIYLIKKPYTYYMEERRGKGSMRIEARGQFSLPCGGGGTGRHTDTHDTVWQQTPSLAESRHCPKRGTL